MVTGPGVTRARDIPRAQVRAHTNLRTSCHSVHVRHAVSMSLRARRAIPDGPVLYSGRTVCVRAYWTIDYQPQLVGQIMTEGYQPERV